MANPTTPSRWLNNPHHRVARAHLLRTMRAALGESDARYQAYKRQLEISRAERLRHKPSK